MINFESYFNYADFSSRKLEEKLKNIDLEKISFDRNDDYFCIDFEFIDGSQILLKVIQDNKGDVEIFTEEYQNYYPEEKE